VSFLIGWSSLVFITMSGRMALLNPDLSASEYVIWFLAASMPMGVSVILLHGRSTASIAQVLYETEQAGGAGQNKRVAHIPSRGGDMRIVQEDKGAKARETLADLYQLVEAISRRVPHAERLSEGQIASNAADLRERAVTQV
jgi:hypothetical protein